jgi:hypothetical protein
MKGGRVVENDRIINLLKDWPVGPNEIRPALIGPSGTGKTYRVRQLAERLSLPVEVRLLHSELPEEFLGVPTRDGEVLRWSYPEWVIALENQPGVLFLDELDKARQENIAVLLTLLWEQRVHRKYLHRNTRIIAAMQPVDPGVFLSDETGLALAGRVCFLPTDEKWRSDILKDIRIPDTYLRGEFALPVSSVVNIRSLDWYVRHVMSGRWPDPETMKFVARGLFPPAFADVLVEQLIERRERATPQGLARIWKDEEVFDALSVPELALIGRELILRRRTADEFFELISWIWIRREEQERASWLELVAKSCYEEVGEGEVETWQDESEESLVEKFQAVANRIIAEKGVKE